jgi:flagellar hook-basal body complex protein FliE
MTKINGIQPSQFLQNIDPKSKAEHSPKTGFKDMFESSLKQVNAAQKESEALTNQLITGEVKDIHQVMIASQKASISLQLTTQVRNKVIESYQEIMRMQV